MSVRAESSRSSRVSSILKTPSIRSKLNNRTPTKVRFKLPHAKKIRNILRDFVKGVNVRDFENLVLLIRDSELLDSDIRNVLSESTRCISLLKIELRLFVEAVLSLKWTHRSADVTSEYQSFLLNLLSAHNYYAKYTIDRLVSNFIPENDAEEWPNGIPSDEDFNKCVVVHGTFNMLIKVVPMCQELFLQSLVNQFPYFKKSAHVHEYYLHNLLWVFEYQPQFRGNIFHLIFSRLVLMDVNASKSDIEKAEGELTQEDLFDMDDLMTVKSLPSDKMRHPVAHTLDVCMDKIFNFILTECFDCELEQVDWEKTKRLYQDMIVVFDRIILPTYNTHHVQFVMFNLCCYKTAITEAFLNYLWKKVSTPVVASVIRQAAMAYLASLISRANFIPLTMLKGTLQQMAVWIHSYIAAQDGLECINSDVKVHAVFYSVCQALFYVIAFRQKDLVNTRKNMSFLESLNLTKIVTSRLNPLRVCLPVVVQKFATVTRNYQLAYCYSVMEHNARHVMPTIYQDDRGSVQISSNILDSFFPFDPYILKRSGQKISPYYVNYQDSVDNNYQDSVDNKTQVAELREFEDDFLTQSEVSPGSKALDKFSYGTSPGFKLKC